MKFFLFRHAWRSISRMRTYTIINLVGLVISLTGTIVIARYVHQELTVDDYVPDVDRVMLLANVRNDGSLTNTEAENWNHVDNWDDPFADASVECYSRFKTPSKSTKVTVDSVKHYCTFVLADSMFLKLLPRKTLEGVQELKNQNDVIVSRAFAQKVWHGESAIGKKIEYDGMILDVVGVVDAIPTKHNFDFDILARYEQCLSMGWCLVKLRPNTFCKDFNKRHKRFVENNGTTNDWHFQLIPLKDVYFEPSFRRHENFEFLKLGDKNSLNMLIGSAVLLLFIGLFNFVNIFTTVITGRRKEFAIKRTMGANTMKLFEQIFIENFIIASVAVGISWIIVSLLSPSLSRFYNITQSYNLRFDVLLSLIILFGIPLLISIPMLFSIGRGKDVDVMKSRFASRLSRHVRMASLTVQYFISFFLLVVSAYTMRQLYYMLNADMGYRTTDIIHVNLVPSNGNPYVRQPEGSMSIMHDDKAKDLVKVLTPKLKESPLFENVAIVDEGYKACLTTRMKVDDIGGIMIKLADSEQDFQIADYLAFSKEMLDIYDIELVEGRMFNDAESRELDYKIIIDERTKELLGIKDIHKEKIQTEHRIWYSVGKDTSTNPPFEIVGVFKEFKTHHLSSRDAPKIIMIEDRSQYVRDGEKFLVRVKPGKRDEAIAYLKKLYAEYVDSNNELEYSLIEDEIAEIYEDDSRLAHIYTTFALLSILVSCMGLFGISLYDIQHRRREIAIRKVNGAKMKDIFILMSRRYVYTLAVAIAIGTPIALYALHVYIEGYAHHVPLTPWYFVLSALLMLTLTLLTIFIQVRRAVKENPADVMKSE